MNRFAKKFRVLGSLCVLLNFVALAFPVTKCIQKNYTDLSWNQLDYIKSVFGEDAFLSVSAEWVMIFMVLPLVLSLIAGIWGMAGSNVQRISSILILAVLPLYIGMAEGLSRFWPEPARGQAYCRGPACLLTLIFSACGAVFAIASLLSVPKKSKEDMGSIPQVEEIKQEQVEKKYRIMMEQQEEPQNEPQNETAHGTLFGQKGVFAGAKITMADGEEIRMGRQSDNHLIFEGQFNVSRNHCRIKWDAGRQKYLFRDYSSTGSFINGAKDCLPQNLDLELEPGTTIAIGDENNTFYLG